MTPDIIEQVALVTGRILHGGTGEPVVGQTRLATAEGTVIDRVFADGTYVISGEIDQLFPNLNGQNYSLTLTVRTESAQFWQGAKEVQLTVPIPMGSSFDSPINAGDVLFEPDPVNIRGRVLDAANPDAPLLNATIEALESDLVIDSALSNAEGRYRLDDITVAAPAEIRCSAGGFISQSRILLIDFGQLNNREDFYLSPS